MSFVNDFLKSLAIPVSDLAAWLEREHRIPLADTIGKWNELTGMKVTMDGSCEEVAGQTVSLAPSTSGTLVPGLNPDLCQHVFIAGNRKGQQCGTKPKGKDNGNRCSAHKIREKKKNLLEEYEKAKKKPTALSEFETDDEQVKEAEAPKKKPVVKKKVPPSSSNSDDSDAEPEEAEAPKKKPVGKKKVPPSSSNSDDSDAN